MNYWVSVIFRAIPLAMMAVCIGFGAYVWTAADAPGNYVAGRVLIALAAICLCLFCTAATIIRQLIKRFNRVDEVLYPALGYLSAVVTVAYGAYLFTGASGSGQDPAYVAGHVVLGVGLICGCVATVATASTKFSLIPANSAKPAGDRTPPPAGFSRGAVVVLEALPVLLAATAWAFAITNLALPTSPSRFTVGHVVSGLAMICTSLIGLVWSILRQVQDSYGPRDRVLWPWLVIVMGAAAMLWGIVLLVLDDEPYYRTPGFVLIGLGLVCFSILSKVGLLALVWRQTFSLANRVPLIPIVTALSCLFLAAFVFQAAFTDTNVFIAAHVLVGLGAVCFTLYSIVSILESGTSSTSD
ncbi:DUF2776 family protein [Nocardioides sp. zg-579]|uniref:DUF2776 family protein n=1 Tax=Nocardioides marmotae TaxID=2663857 RepID=A0A6I3JEZ9_9ACTN|nr:DUF2776 family protein [Nocardioides marmotae]MCR6033027.1 DUF2776 family protein [Gordonia jinghuaiqii]MTB96679.1 DUF2776 family protein [Nocardioides marmotae]QKE03106.1 DUF2776 family protein [Nocardioides marmotae]